MKMKTNNPASAASSPLRTSTSPSTTRPYTYTYEEIATHARALWEKRGRPEGQDEQIWYDAEKELKAKQRVTTDERRFADPDRLLDKDGDPADEVDQRLNELARPRTDRSATSL